MQDSDDYDYFDEFTEADLAAADEVENKYVESQRTQALQRTPSESELPPAKRQKTVHVGNGPNGAVPQWPANSGMSTNDRLARSSSLHSAAAILPDVPLANGYFKPGVQFGGNGRASPATNNHVTAQQPLHPARPETTQSSSIARNNNHVTLQAQRAPNYAGRPAPGQRAPAPPTTRPIIAQRAPTPPVARPISSQHGSTPSSSPYAAHGRTATPPVARPSPVSRVPSTSALRPPHIQRQPSGLRERTTTDDEKLRREMEGLRVQMEALKQEQAQLQETLRRAEDVRMAKEGEVSILRKGIQKTAQEHAAEIAKIKAAKEAAEAMQLKIQNEKKEEIDRLKTQYTFKQHELETSGRSSPWSGRSRKISRQAPPTPIRVPSQMREWNPLGIDHDAGLINFNDAITSTQQSNGSRRGHEFGQAVVEKPKIPGFFNAFDSSPPRPSQAARARGKQHESARNGPNAEVSDNNFFSQPSTQYVSSPKLHSTPPSPPVSPLGHKHARKNQGQIQLGIWNGLTQTQEQTQRPVDHDVEMFDEPKDDDESDEAKELPTTDWAAEVHRIILTHRCPDSTQLTLQVLMGTTQLDIASQDHRDAYSRLSKILLENMGVMLSEMVDEDHTIRTILDILVEMADVLETSSAMAPLISLLNLLRVLVLWLPAFSRLMFARPEGAEAAGDRIFEVVCKIICAHVAPVEGERSPEFQTLAKETLGLLEDVAWVIPEEHTSRLAAVPVRQDVMSILLAPAHPTWFLYHSVRVLVLIASHHSIFRSLLTIPDEPIAMDTDEAPAKDYSKIPHIEQMAFHLRDKTRTGTEADHLRDAIMTFVATLCMAHTDAVTILQQSQLFIPSILVFLSNITTPLFEEDPELLDAPERLEATVMRSVRTVSVLYTLVFAAENQFTLYHKFRRVSPRDIPSIYDITVVTLGRLSWADPPLEATEEMKNLLDQALDLSRALLETFVEGPMLEMVWSAFQVGDEDADAEEGGMDEDDDEEAEARNQHPPSSIEV